MVPISIGAKIRTRRVSEWRCLRFTVFALPLASGKVWSFSNAYTSTNSFCKLFDCVVDNHILPYLHYLSFESNPCIPDLLGRRYHVQSIPTRPRLARLARSASYSHTLSRPLHEDSQHVFLIMESYGKWAACSRVLYNDSFETPPNDNLQVQFKLHIACALLQQRSIGFVESVK
jgi:hypothetical protein